MKLFFCFKKNFRLLFRKSSVPENGTDRPRSRHGNISLEAFSIQGRTCSLITSILRMSRQVLSAVDFLPRPDTSFLPLFILFVNENELYFQIFFYLGSGLIN